MEMRQSGNNKSYFVERVQEVAYRRLRARERAAKRRQNETPEQTALRRLQDRLRVAKRRMNESLQEKMIRREMDRERKARDRRKDIERRNRILRRRESRNDGQFDGFFRPQQKQGTGGTTNLLLLSSGRNDVVQFSNEYEKEEEDDVDDPQQIQLEFTKKDNEKIEPITQDYPNRLRSSSRSKPPSETLSSADSLFQHFFLPEPTDAELQMKQESRQMAYSGATLMDVPPHPVRTSMRVPQHLQVASSSTRTQPCPRQEKVMTHPVQVIVGRTKPPEKPQPRQQKQLLAIANHQRDIMKSLATLWKSGKLCDAGLGNGSATVKVHKVVLSAVCPKLLSAFSADMFSHKFMQVNFPEKVSKEALKAFAEYMYNGLLNLDPNILEQLKIIANKLDMREFEKLCNHHLPKHMQQQPASSSSVGGNVPFVQPTVPIPAMGSPLASALSNSLQSPSSDFLDIKQEISEDDLAQVLFGRESVVAPLAPNKSGNDVAVVVTPTPVIKTEPVGPEDNEYGHWSGGDGGSTPQAFTSNISASASSSPSITPAAPASSSIISVPASSTEFAIPFSERADDKSTRLKSNVESELSAVSAIVKQFVPKCDPTSRVSPRRLTRSSVSMSSTEGPSTLTSNEGGVYPVELFTSGGGNLPLLTTQTVASKTMDLYQTHLT